MCIIELTYWKRKILLTNLYYLHDITYHYYFLVLLTKKLMFGKQYRNICQRYQLNSLFLVLLIVNNDCTWVKFELFQIVTVWPWKGWLDFFYTCLCLHMQMGKRWVFFSWGSIDVVLVFRTQWTQDMFLFCA